MAPRILLSGDVLGRLNALYKRVISVNKSSGPFDVLFCVGQFFPDSSEQLDEFMSYIDGRSQVPIPTYFIGDYGAGAPKVLGAAARESGNQGFKMDGFKVCDNLFWLRGSGKFTIHGLSVVYLSGKSGSSGQPFGTYSQDDVDALRALAEEPGIVDLFLTNEWPSGVSNRSSVSDVPDDVSSSPGSDSTLSELLAEIKPRYHIAGSKGVYFAREPYCNIDAVHVTRFMGLAPVGNKDKQRFLHALSPTPASTMTSTEISVKPANTTLSPYISVKQTGDLKESEKRHIDDDSDSQYWRYEVSNKRQKHGAVDGDRLCFKFVSSGSCPRGEQCNFRHDEDAREQSLRGVCFDFLNKGKCERGPDCSFKHSLQDEKQSNSHRRNRSKECWFCLSSPNVESHLIISVGENYYCAMPKGPLVEDHVLLIPIEHAPNTLVLSPDCEAELIRFQNSLQKFNKTQGKEVVYFEWVSRRGTHANLQAIPVPSSRASSVQDIFKLAAKKLEFEFDVIKSDNGTGARNLLRTQFDSKSSLFYVELPDGTILSHLVEENERFSAQFGREVLAGLLNMADRADWRDCTLEKGQETRMAGKFKKLFDKFDPNN